MYSIYIYCMCSKVKNIVKICCYLYIPVILNSNAIFTEKKKRRLFSLAYKYQMTICLLSSLTLK